ncbi:MAG: T9SS C-terminal target domain-containing protein [Calditrichaeota bacterium]|nr:MAG: T9SS C-terminal target domain-containing protein [Calditrichota bacterium]
MQFSNIKVMDIDNDGPNHMDLVVTTPNGEHVGQEAGIFLLEFNATSTPVFVEFNAPNTVPKNYALHQNYPNPFNPSTNIVYELPVGARVKLEIYNILGQKIKTLVDRDMPLGVHQIAWDGTDDHGRRVSSGIYVYVLKAGTFKESKRMLLLK